MTATPATKIEIDLSVFKDDSYFNECDKNADDQIKGCKQLNRLILSLKYYSILDIINNNDDKEIFNDFMGNIYYQLLDDYNHLIIEHGEYLEEINKSLISNPYFGDCDIKNCSFTMRHYQYIKNALDPITTFYKQTMDSLHFYIFHLFHVGMRIMKESQINDDIKCDDQDNNHNRNDTYFDKQFSRIITEINSRKFIMTEFNDFNRFKTNKFSIDIEEKQKGDNGSSTTYIEEMYQYLKMKQIKSNSVSSLKKYIDDEQYDTDSLQMDVDGDLNGNILNNTNNKKLVEEIYDFIKSHSLKSSSFSVGWTFYYWSHYKKMKEFDCNNDKYNINDHGGEEICNLYIKPKYNSFKDEIANYKHFEFANYNNSVIIKVNQYIKTKMVKQSKADYTGKLQLKYDIESAEPLSFRHLISIILYTDFTALSHDFSSSFRGLKSYEPLSSIKSRNANYFFFAKHLRELVQLYGEHSRGIWDREKRKDINKLSGSFFCGLSFALVFPEYEIRLCSPTSTTKQISVAHRFGGNQGIVVELNNTVYGHQHLRGFNCSFISSFKEEDEVLFFGGHYRIKIETVKMVKTKQNFSLFFGALNKFNRIFNGFFIKSEDINKKEKRILSLLINWKMGINDNMNAKFPPYIYQTFDAFCHHKTTVTFNLFLLSHVFCDKELIEMIMYETKSGKDYKPSDTDKTNIFRGNVLFKLFDNIQNIYIYTTSNNGNPKYQCPLSFISLLSEIENESFNQLTIRAVKSDKHSKTFDILSWISSLWSTCSAKLIQNYQQKNWNILLKNTKNQLDRIEDCVFISKI